MNIIELALEYRDYFTKATRNNGEEFFKLREENERLTELIYTCHQSTAPDDWIYETVYEAISAIADADDEDSLEDIELEADIYNRDLLNWARNFYYYCDQYLDQIDPSDRPASIMTILQMGNYLHKAEILSTVINSLREQVEEINSEEEGEEE